MLKRANGPFSFIVLKVVVCGARHPSHFFSCEVSIIFSYHRRSPEVDWLHGDRA